MNYLSETRKLPVLWEPEQWNSLWSAQMTENTATLEKFISPYLASTVQGYMKNMNNIVPCWLLKKTIEQLYSLKLWI